MQTFDQALYQLYNQGKVSYNQALCSVDSTNGLRLMIKLGTDIGVDQLSAAGEYLRTEKRTASKMKPRTF